MQNKFAISPLNILDIGCGTGAIGISLAAMLPHANVTAIDIEPIAVETSNENARRILGTNDSNRYTAVQSFCCRLCNYTRYGTAFT